MTPRPDGCRTWALLPVKSPQSAKSRLSPLLAVGERAALQRALLMDVLRSLSGAASLEGIAVICPDPEIGTVARGLGAVFIAEEPPTGDLNQALAMGVRRLREAGADLVAIIPADLPLVEAADIDLIVGEAVRRRATIVVPDRFWQGTNALVFRADGPPELGFGPDSFRRHLSARGCRPALSMELGSLALDIDRPEDIARLREVAAPGRAAETLAMLASASSRLGTPVIVDV
jgi:2-phospho-L-lactate guanylyltransferase